MQKQKQTANVSPAPPGILLKRKKEIRTAGTRET